MDGRPLFSHTDGDDERVEVFQAPNAGHLHIVGTTNGSYLPRAEVLSLIQALTEWAYPHHTPEGPNRSLIEELIVKAVKDQVSAVLPLHLSPAASGGDGYWRKPGDVGTTPPHRPQECPGAGRCPEAEPCNEPLRPGQILMETHKECGLLWVTHRPDEDPEADPEPGDVGHPRPPVAEPKPGDACAEPACGHMRDRHRPNCAQFAPGKGVCRCNAFQERVALPVRERMWRPEDSRPKGPYCGLCKQPWNDGHGQPGDPCPGVEEARQHPGDWTDALWRVRPSAPASEARYCDGCGHSWEVHAERGVADTWCTATKGKGRCGCTRRPE